MSGGELKWAKRKKTNAAIDPSQNLQKICQYKSRTWSPKHLPKRINRTWKSIAKLSSPTLHLFAGGGGEWGGFMYPTLFGDAGVSLFVGGTIFGDVAVSLFVPGGIFEEIWVDSQSAKWVFEIKMRCRGRKISSANGRVQFCNFMAPHVWQVSCILPSQRWQALPGAMFGRWRGLAQRCEHACERWTKCCDISIGNFFLWTYRQVPCWNFHPRLARFTCIRTFKKGPNIRPGLQASGSANLSPDQ